MFCYRPSPKEKGKEFNGSIVINGELQKQQTKKKML